MGQGLGLRGAAGRRRPGGDAHRPLPQPTGYQGLLAVVEAANPTGPIYVVADDSTSHASRSTLEWLADHPRITQVFIPKGACWSNLVEAWWRIFRRAALAGQSFADGHEIDEAARIATDQLNRQARPWVWGRPPRRRRRHFVYLL